MLFQAVLAFSSASAAPAKNDAWEHNPWNISDKRAWINWKAVDDPWRAVGGQTNYVPRAEDWYLVHGRVLQVANGGVLISAVCTRGNGDSEERTFLLKNYPRQVVDEDKLKPFVAKLVGEQSYTTVLGAKKTVRVLDFGRPVAAQPPTKKGASFRPIRQAAATARQPSRGAPATPAALPSPDPFCSFPPLESSPLARSSALPTTSNHFPPIPPISG